VPTAIISAFIEPPTLLFGIGFILSQKRVKKLIFISRNKKSCQLIDKVVNILWITFENLFVTENNWIVRQMLLAKETFLFIINMKRT